LAGEAEKKEKRFVRIAFGQVGQEGVNRTVSEIDEDESSRSFVAGKGLSGGGLSASLKNGKTKVSLRSPRQRVRAEGKKRT